jgi:hypothetical protein
MQRQLPACFKGKIDCRQENFSGCAQVCEILGDGSPSRPWAPGELLLAQPSTEPCRRSVAANVASLNSRTSASAYKAIFELLPLFGAEVGLAKVEHRGTSARSHL